MVVAATRSLIIIISIVIGAGAAYRQLPEGNLIIAYATSCNSSELKSEVVAGVNVLIWFSIKLVSENNTATIKGGPNVSCARGVRESLDAEGFEDVVHLMSIGGWDAAHPNSTVASGSEWWSLFEAYGGGVFDGIDWDLEGFDNLDSPYNKVNFSTLELIHDMSASAKAAGAVVSLVPPQSYFDVTESRFDLRLTNTYLDFKPDFRYRGRNTYAPLVVWNASLYDFVDLQLYESWSRAAQAIEQLDWDPAAYLAALVGAMERGWTVDFGAGVARVAVEPKKLVLGFSRGSDSDPEKSVYIDPSAAAAAFAALPPDRRFRGVMFWNAHLDGGPCWLPNGTQITCDFAAGFNNFLHVR